MKTGTVSAYASREGRGQITLDDGEIVDFNYRAVEIPAIDQPSRDNWNAPIGCGFEVRVGDRVVYDRNHSSRPIRMAANQ